MENDIKQVVSGLTGLTNEQITKLHPGHEKLFNSVGAEVQVRIVAEVVKSEHCFAQVQKGDKLVFDPYLNPDKSTGVMCPRALLPVLIQISAIWEMGVEWAQSEKEDLPEIVWRNIRCMDPGFEDGGVGGVVYKIYQEKM